MDFAENLHYLHYNNKWTKKVLMKFQVVKDAKISFKLWINFVKILSIYIL